MGEWAPTESKFTWGQTILSWDEIGLCLFATLRVQQAEARV